MFIDFCASKKRHSSQGEARRALSRMRQHKSSYEDAHVYFCLMCKGYHIGHKD